VDISTVRRKVLDRRCSMRQRRPKPYIAEFRERAIRKEEREIRRTAPACFAGDAR
jgi:hypothetical protein